ncbi:hypothetical protein JVU11DRAFT_4350 [Chiua virens]|nr:hypothetical protein JVU11DRAFT_4350 [Chiua virens]
MLSLRMTVARTRPTKAIHSLSTLCRSAYSTSTQSDREKRRKSPHNSSTLIQHAPGWREDLATASEAFVKADRETITVDRDEMQQRTARFIQSQASDSNGPLTDSEAEQTHATYAREEVSGPLGNAGVGVGEFEGVVGNDDLGPDQLDVHVESNGRVVTRRTIHGGVGGPGAAQANV